MHQLGCGVVLKITHRHTHTPPHVRTHTLSNTSSVSWIVNYPQLSSSSSYTIMCENYAAAGYYCIQVDEHTDADTHTHTHTRTNMQHT